MINDKYALNQKAVTELFEYLKFLREKGGLSLRELGYYSDVTAIALGAGVVGIYNFFPIYELIHKYQSLVIV